MTPRKPILSLPAHLIRYDARPLGFLPSLPGPADMAWAREALEKARVGAARNLAWFCMLNTIQKIDGGWRPPPQLVEGPRR